MQHSRLFDWDVHGYKRMVWELERMKRGLSEKKRGRPRKKVEDVPPDKLIPGHHCSSCGMPGFPADFGLCHSGTWNTICRECRARMALYREEARRQGLKLAPLDKRQWWQPVERDLVEQRLCWEYIDKDISEDAWMELCDAAAGPSESWKQ